LAFPLGVFSRAVLTEPSPVGECLSWSLPAAQRFVCSALALYWLSAPHPPFVGPWVFVSLPFHLTKARYHPLVGSVLLQRPRRGIALVVSGVRLSLRVSGPFSASVGESTRRGLCLPATFRPRAFSLLDGLLLTHSVWACFIPKALVGFPPPGVFPSREPLRVSAPVPLMAFVQRQS
jgi:hypothetical protein